MALITCPECSKEISDQATACPSCGYPLTQEVDSTPADKVQKTSQPGALFGFLMIILVAGAIYMIAYHPENSKNDFTPNDEISNSEPSNSSRSDYTGTYHDLDGSTGWETTIRINGNSFNAATISTLTNEVIASTSGKVDGDNLINEYGQPVGTVSNYTASINVGSAHITCSKN